MNKDHIHTLEDIDSSKIGTYTLFNQEAELMYVGSSGDCDKRTKEHLRNLKNGKHVNYKLQKAYNKNSNFQASVVPMDTRNDALALEDMIIKENWGKPYLLNLALDATAPNLGIKASDESRLKMSITHKKRWQENPQLREDASFRKLGTKLSDEAKDNLSKSAKVRYSDPEYKTKFATALTGRKFSDEAKENLRQARVKYWDGNEDAKKEHSKTLKEICGTDEFRLRASQKSIERFKDPEQREILSKSTIKRFEDLQAREVLRQASLKQWQDPVFRATKSKKVLILGKEYNSLSEAALENKVSLSAVHTRVNSEKWAEWNYV